MWPTVEPGAPYVHGWHQDAVCEHLEAVTHGQIRRLLINIPFGMMKSLSCSVFWPAWEWGPAGMPWLRYIGTSYRGDYADRDSRKMRDVVASEVYQRHWHVPLERGGETSFSNSHKGSRDSVPFTSLTGGRGDRLIIDDPHSTETAESDLERGRAIRIFRESVPSRLNDQRTSAIVIIMQRLHEADVSGVALALDLGYTHLCYPADVEVLARSGWKRFADVGPYEEVMAVDPATLRGRWERPTRHIRYPYRGEIKRYSSDVLDLAVTPDHRMVFKDYNDWKKDKRKNWRVAPAFQLPKHFYVPQAIEWHGADAPVTFAGRIWAPSAFAEFMGWYLAEGCASEKRCLTRIVQAAGPKADEITAMLARTPFPTAPRRHGRDGMLVWSIGSKPLAATLEPLGKSWDKRAPEEVKALAPAHLQTFLTAYAKGDGHFAARNHQKITIASRSKRMIDDLQECAVKAGWAASACRCEVPEGGTINGYRRPGGTMWKLYIRASKISGQARKWYAKVRAENCSTEFYDGEVFCVSVPSTALVVRRNGRVAISGNCLPMEFDPARRCITYVKGVEFFRDPRTHEGELLFPERFPRAEVDALKKALGAYASAGQMQQSPVPREGKMFKRGWFDLVPSAPADCRWMRWWDVADTEEQLGSDPAFTAGVKLGYSASTQMFYVADVKRAREEAPEIRRLIKATAGADGLDCHIGLPIDPGGAGKGRAKDMVRMLPGFVVHTERETGSKVVRAEPVQSQAEAGLVKIVRGSAVEQPEWIEPFLSEIEKFPSAAHKDQVDALANAFAYLVGDAMFNASEENLVTEARKIPSYWQQAFAFDLDHERFAAIWAARDPQTDTVYLFDEYRVVRAELAVHKEAMVRRGAWVPGLFDLNGRGRKRDESIKIVDRLSDQLNLFTVDVEEQAALEEMRARLSTGRLRVFSHLNGWLGEYRQFRKESDGETAAPGGDHLIKATAMLLTYIGDVATSEAASAQEVDYDRDRDERKGNRTTGY